MGDTSIVSEWSLIMPRVRSIVSVGLIVSGALPAGVLGQAVAYEKYKLDNGLTVILHEDHSLPVGAINLWYRVGSKDEPPRRSGFAHLFEHLMFMGTQRVPGNEFDVIMESGGGANNATTSSDRTNYFSSGPASLLPTLLWLDADRLEDLGRMMDQEKLDKQRDVVRNERRQSYENRPYGKAELRIPELMYPPGHPYHIPVIGTHEDLEAATVTDVKDFFANYYVPNNTALVVAGDFEASKLKPLIARLFGTLPRGSDPAHRTAGAVKLDRVIRATMLDDVQLPMIAYAYHSPPIFADGDAEMDLAGAVLSEGKTSRLYKRLVYEDKVAVSVSAYQDSSQLGSIFRIDVLTNPDADLDVVEKTIDEEIARLLKSGPTEQELERQQSRIELARLSRLQSIEAKADQLNAYEYYFGEPNSFKRDLDRYRKATPGSVQGWAKQVLTPDARLVLRVLPEQPQREQTPRDTRPDALAMGKFEPPLPETFKLANGISVMLWQKRELPLVAADIVFVPPVPLDTREKAGIGLLMATMMGEGAGELSALQFSDAMQSLGAEFDAATDRESINVSLRVLQRSFDKAMALTALAIGRPSFQPEEWERVKRIHLEELKQDEDEPRTVASRVAARILFGDGHPYGWPLPGTAETVSTLAVSDIKRLHSVVVRPEYATVLLAGDVTLEEARAALERHLGDWQPAGSPTLSRERDAFETPARDGLQVVIVDRPEAVQTVVQFIMPGPKFHDERRVPYRLLNTLFGGSFTSRLNQNLREEHGYTYGARSNYAMEPSSGYFTAASSVRADVTGASVNEFLKEIARVRGGDISDDEAGKARETVRTDIIQSFSGLSGLVGMISELVVNKAPLELIGKDMATMQKVSAAALNVAAKTAIPLESGVLVLVGDKRLILEQIKDLKLPEPIEVNVRGDRVGS